MSKKEKVEPSTEIKPQSNETNSARKNDQFIYIGQSLPGGRLGRFSLFKGFPEYLKDIEEELPELRSLFVPVKEFNQAQVAVDTAGTSLNVAYESVVIYGQKGV